MVGLDTSSTSSGSRVQRPRNGAKGRAKANGEVNGAAITAPDLHTISQLSNEALVAHQAHVRQQAASLQQVVDGIDRELANRSELSRTQISLQEANARNAELVGKLDYLRQASADQYNHLQYEREADKRQWQSEMQSRDTELQRLQSELQRLASEVGQRSTELQIAREETAAAHELHAEARNEVQELRRVTDAVKIQHQAQVEDLTVGRSVAERERDQAQHDRTAALQRLSDLTAEKDHVMAVLGEWQHYGRTRNSDFESIYGMLQQKDSEIQALKQQLSTHGLATAFAGETTLPQRLEPLRAPGLTSEAPLAAPLPAVGSGSLSGIGLQGGGANGLQSSNPDGHHAAGQPYAPPQSGLPQSAKRHSEASEEHVLAVLRQLLPASESEAVTLTSAFDRALEAQLVPLSWACDFAPVYGSVMNFMAQRQQLFMQRRVDGFWYMPQQVPSGHGSASFPAFRSQTDADIKAQNLTPRDAPVAPPGAGTAASAISRPSPSGQQRSVAPSTLAQQGPHQNRRAPADAPAVQLASSTEPASQAQELSQDQQASAQPEPAPGPASRSAPMVIVTPLHPEGAKLMEQRRRQQVKPAVEASRSKHGEPASKTAQPSVLTIPRPPSRGNGIAAIHADPQRRVGGNLPRQSSDASNGGGSGGPNNVAYHSASDTASNPDASGGPNKPKRRKSKWRGEPRAAADGPAVVVPAS